MGFKSKLFGFGAASVLALSMTTGAMAQQASDTNVEVTLAGTFCTVAFTSSDVDFGTWTWDGEEEKYDGNGGPYDLTADLNSGRPGGTCDVMVQFAGLSDGANVVIGLENFEGSALGTTYGPANLEGSGLDVGLTGVDLEAGELKGTLELVSVPDLDPDTYSGTITLSIAATN